VGVRRLRSALSLFPRVLPPEQSQPLREELRWLGGELGAARDLDVFLDEILSPIRLQFPDDPALKRLRDAAHELRDAAYTRVRAALASKRYTGLLFALGAFAAGRRWREQTLTPDSARLFAPARALATELLARRYRKARRLGRGLAQRTRAEKHALRIQLKKLRYAAEFFRGLYPGGRAAKTIRRLTGLQDILGHLNDQAMAEQMLEQILEHLGPEATLAHERATGFVAGWCARSAQDCDLRLVKQWKRFTRAEPFWSEPASG
jgi:CHAD domain-containing protein